VDDAGATSKSAILTVNRAEKSQYPSIFFNIKVFLDFLKYNKKMWKIQL
jgi:hypothetical protein